MTHDIHTHHDHIHNSNCGHTAIQHGDHIDYLHDGHLHRPCEDHYHECNIEISDTNPAECNEIEITCMHNENCGHEQVPHGNHICYLVDGRLEHVHGEHIDDHGPIEVL